MKTRKIILILLLAMGLSFAFSSCKKDDSTVKGTVSYKNLIGTYVADGATIYLMRPGSNDYYQKTTTDSDGKYEFYPVDDGSYNLEGEYSDGILNYSGKSEEFNCEKDDIITFDLVLE